MKTRILYLLIFSFTTTFYGQIQSYYNGLDLNKTGNDLYIELSNRLKSTHTSIPYTGTPPDVWSVLKDVDEDPTNSLNVLLIYGSDDSDGDYITDRTRAKTETDTGGGDVGKWNREHVFAKSLAIPALVTDSPGPGTDVHNLKPADSQQNSLRSNRKFTDGSGDPGIQSSNGGWYPGDEWKGDVARIVMYMYLRYNGDGSLISETQCLPINIGFGTGLTVDENMIDLFLRWNAEDPVSAFEDQRNPIIEGIQGNRNPFIDNPYLATLIWGGLNAEDRWDLNNNSDSEAPSAPENLTATNITDETVDISWDASTDNIGVFDYLIYLNGSYLQSATSTSTTINGLTANTSYQITVRARDAASNLSQESNLLNVTTLEGPLYLFSEDFSDCGNLNFLSYSEASDKNWGCEVQYGENNSGSMGINGYQENELSKDWLVTTNPINFDSNTNEKLSFYTDAAYGSSPLELLYSSDYDGISNPAEFNWSSVPNLTIPIHSDGTSSEEVYKFTNIDLNSITGSVYFAFKYYSNGVPTRWTVDNFEIFVENPNEDSDNDGVLNSDDLCPNTPIGEIVDANGCSNGQLDDDNDGVQNSDDSCPNTPTGDDVNSTGCGQSQLDDDGDGVMNNVDICPNTPAGETVDVNGCWIGELDDDNDGVQNSDDLCSNTPTGEAVNSTGCGQSQLDDDNDSVMNNVDVCPNTPVGETVDVNGCWIGELDDDNDGVQNSEDLCPNSSANRPVDSSGCFTLPSNNFEIETIGETCPDRTNGQILITAVENYNYSTTINGTVYNFTTSTGLTAENLMPGTYDFCISVDGETYEQCYSLTIEEGTVISGKTSVDKNKVAIQIENGTAPYKVYINGDEVLETSTKTFSLNVNHGDFIEVKTNVACEGVLAKNIELLESFTLYPNPTVGSFEIAMPNLAQNKSSETVISVPVEIYNIQGQLISKGIYPINYGKIQLNIEDKPSGVYVVKIMLETPIIMKIVRSE